MLSVHLSVIPYPLGQFWSSSENTFVGFAKMGISKPEFVSSAREKQAKTSAPTHSPS